MTTDLPSGTVTFLFTDIQGSTPLWEREPTRMQPALAQHNAILRQAVEAQRGHVFKVIGDAFQAAFSLPAAGLAAALAAQRELEAAEWPTSTPLRVRMGLHTGPAEPDGADYATTHTLNRVARIMAAAHGGQVVLSAEVAELLHGYLPPDSNLRDLGQHRMKGMAQREHLFQLLAPGLSANFPLLPTLDALPNNLPVQLTSFVGREREIAEARRLLSATHLLTLTGPGGTGKTRLSLRIAAEVLPENRDGAWLVELAPLADPAYVMPALAAVLGVRESPGRPLLAMVTDYLRAKQLLLVLDNCEHLIEACAQLADDLLHACPGLKILASSREALGVGGETAYRVPSLTLPDPRAVTVASLARGEAARLFVERAQAAQPRFTLTEHNAPVVATICQRLDGIPLALELAAARVRVLNVDQILARLDDRFRLLVGGSRTALPRQQTLRALIDWSYDLLPEDERRLLRALSVFAGGCTLEAAEAVGKDDGGPHRATEDRGPSDWSSGRLPSSSVSTSVDVLDLLTGLVNKSLVVMDNSPTVRYGLLETIRQYAREKLLDQKGGEMEGARNRHLGYFLQLTEAAEPRLTGADMIAALDELEAEQDNLRAALEWAVDRAPVAVLRMMAVLYWFFGRRLSSTEGRQWVAAALVAAEHAPDAAEPDSRAARARALVAEAALAFGLGDNSAALAAATAGIALARQVDAPRTLALALGIGLSVCLFLGDLATARAWADESLAVSRQHGYRYELSLTLSTSLFLSVVAKESVSLVQSDEVLSAARASGNPWAIGMAIQNVARTAMVAGDFARAQVNLEESAAIYRDMRDRPLYNTSQSELGHVLRLQGRHGEAEAIYLKTLRVWQELGQFPAVAHELECLAFVAVAGGQVERAATLFGAAEALRELIGSSMTLIERREYDLALAQLRGQTEPAIVEAAWAQGRTLSLDAAVAYALAEGQ